MIDLTKLYYGKTFPSDRIRFGAPGKAIIVWTMTTRCNLNCIHCYAQEPASVKEAARTFEALKIIDKIAEYDPAALLLSGGEPLLRSDFFHLARYAAKNGLRLTLSTNGTLINKETASMLYETGFNYVGISIDGPPEVHNLFRRKKNTFKRTLQGIRNCKEVGLKVGVRLTITKLTAAYLDFLFELAKAEQIDRLCFYHLYPAGRAINIGSIGLSPSEKISFMNELIRQTEKVLNDNIQVLTVGNHFDGVYLYLKAQRENRDRAKDILVLLEKASATRTPVKIININENGDVFPDQFSRQTTLGNVFDSSLTEIISDYNNSIRNSGEKQGYTRCKSCDWSDFCTKNAPFAAKSQPVEQICYLPLGLFVAQKRGHNTLFLNN